MDTWDRDQEAGRLASEYHVRRARERAEASARLLAPLAALAAIIAPEVMVYLGGGHEGRAGDFTYSRRVPVVVIYEYSLVTESIRDAAELDAVLLHELAHYLLGHLSESGQFAWRSPGLAHLRDVDTQGEADALAVALAEHYAPSLNAPLADVLDCFR